MCCLTCTCESKLPSQVAMQNFSNLGSGKRNFSTLGQINTPGCEPEQCRAVGLSPCRARTEAWDWLGSASLNLNVDAAPNRASKQLRFGFQRSCSSTGGREIPEESWVLAVRCIHVQNMQRIIW